MYQDSYEVYVMLLQEANLEYGVPFLAKSQPFLSVLPFLPPRRLPQKCFGPIEKERWFEMPLRLRYGARPVLRFVIAICAVVAGTATVSLDISGVKLDGHRGSKPTLPQYLGGKPEEQQVRNQLAST